MRAAEAHEADEHAVRRPPALFITVEFDAAVKSQLVVEHLEDERQFVSWLHARPEIADALEQLGVRL